MNSWGVLVAQHQRVKLAQQSLVAQNVDHFIPLEENLCVVRGRHIRENKPMLGNYILIAVTEIWQSLMRMRGVAGILMSDDGFPAQVLPSEINYLRSICVNGVYRPRMIKSQRGFTYGQRVTPQHGPFAHHVGRYENPTKDGDTALFMLFGYEQKVSFKPGNLVAA